MSRPVISISIHTFLAEGDVARKNMTLGILTFQSTPSLRKVTGYVETKGKGSIISIHTFLAEGDWDSDPSGSHKYISIHTFLAEGDG